MPNIDLSDELFIEMSSFWKNKFPDFIGITPMIDLSKVLFPTPFLPVIESISPWLTAKEKEFITVVDP